MRSINYSIIFFYSKFPAKPHTISNVSDDDDSDDEMLMRPLFERLGGGKSDSEKMVISFV